MAKRLYWESLKKWSIRAGITGVSLVSILFIYLQFAGLITVLSHSGDSTCAGTLEDPCYAEISFIPHEDIFIYKTNYDPWGRNTPVNFGDGITEWKLERSWGSDWREINLEEGCTGSWCGCSWCKDGITSDYAYVFRTGRTYKLRITAYKEDPTQDIKWGFADLDPIWYGVEKKKKVTSHTFSNGIVSSENFNVIFENGKLKANYLNYTLELVPFEKKSDKVKKPKSLKSDNLPFKKLDKTSYEYNITTDLSDGVETFGLSFNTNMDDIEVDDDEIRFGDGETFHIILSGFQDIIEKKMNYTLNENELNIETKGLSKIDFDPTITFTTEQVESVALCPLDNETFVVAWCDEVADDIEFLIYYTNGTAKISQVSVDETVGSCLYTGVGVSAYNSTHFVIGWHDDVDDDVSFAIYDNTGTLKVGPIDVDESAGDFGIGAVSVSTFNETTFVIGWYDRDGNTARFNIRNNLGDNITEVIADASIGLSFAVSVSSFNDTHFVIGWFDDTDEDTTFAIYDSSGNLKSGPIDVDTNSGGGGYESRAVSVSTFNETYFVIGWYDNFDGTDDDITFAIYDSSGTLKAGPIDADINIGPLAQSVSVSTFNETHFSIGWFHDTDDDATFAIYDSSGILKAGPTDSSTTALGFQAVSSNQTATGIGLSDSNSNPLFVHAYVISTSLANFTVYNADGTIYTGEEAPSDTCTCADSNNNWEVTMSDNCNITESCDIGTGNLTFTSTGFFNCSTSLKVNSIGDLTSGQIIYITEDCILNITG